MSNINHIKKHLSDDIEELNAFLKKNLKSDLKILNSILFYILRRKGKQIRPILVFLSARLINNTTQKTVVAASMIELLHTATLVHDDVVDNSELRRGFFSINALWKNKIAVLIGDFLLSKGLLMATENQSFDILTITANAVKKMSQGELLQIEKARTLDIDEDIYFSIIKNKTAALIAACCLVGGKSANANEEQMEQLKKFGINAGIAFQIKDDLFTYTPSKKIGKPSNNDLIEKKMSLPLIYAIKQAGFFEKKTILHSIRKKKKSSKDIKKIIDFVHQKKGVDYTIQKMKYYHNQALLALNELPKNKEQTHLKDLLNFIVEREK